MKKRDLESLEGPRRERLNSKGLKEVSSVRKLRFIPYPQTITLSIIPCLLSLLCQTSSYTSPKMKTTMQLLACFLSVGSVVGLSVPSPRAAIEIPDNGDGLYVVQVDENNIPVGAQFTALANVTAMAAVESTDTTLVARNALDKRAGVTCSGRGGNTDIDSAQGCLANAANGATWQKNAWVYVST